MPLASAKTEFSKPPFLRKPILLFLLFLNLSLAFFLEHLQRKLPESAATLGTTTANNSEKAVLLDDSLDHGYQGPTSTSTTVGLVDWWLKSTSCASDKYLTTCTDGAVLGCFNMCTDEYLATVFLDGVGAVTSFIATEKWPRSRGCFSYYPNWMCSRTTPAGGYTARRSEYSVPFRISYIFNGCPIPASTPRTTDCGWWVNYSDCWAVYWFALLVDPMVGSVTSITIQTTTSATKPPGIQCLDAAHFSSYLSIPPTLTSSPSPTTTPVMTAVTTSHGITPAPAPVPTASAANWDDHLPLTTADWALGTYGPVLIAVVFRNLWLLVYTNIRLMDPLF